MKARAMKLSEEPRRALFALGDAPSNYGAPSCLAFRTIADWGAIEPKRVRRAVRFLARKGLAEYHRGLFNEDGQVAGSGYAITPAGSQLLAKLELELEADWKPSLEPGPERFG